MFYFLGRMVEGVLAAGRLLILYVAGAYAAAFAEYLVSPESTVPVIRASGAVSAVLGAYAIYFGNRTAPSGRFLSSETRTLSWLATAWIGRQLLSGLRLNGHQENGGCAGGKDGVRPSHYQ